MWPFCENPICPDPVWKLVSARGTPSISNTDIFSRGGFLPDKGKSQTIARPRIPNCADSCRPNWPPTQVCASDHMAWVSLVGNTYVSHCAMPPMHPMHPMHPYMITQSYRSKGIWRQGICKELLCFNTTPCRHMPYLCTSKIAYAFSYEWPLPPHRSCRDDFEEPRCAASPEPRPAEQPDPTSQSCQSWFKASDLDWYCANRYPCDVQEALPSQNLGVSAEFPDGDFGIWSLARDSRVRAWRHLQARCAYTHVCSTRLGNVRASVCAPLRRPWWRVASRGLPIDR